MQFHCHTEEFSLFSLQMAGIDLVGRDQYYGVFPLRGKLLNVIEARHNRLFISSCMLLVSNNNDDDNSDSVQVHSAFDYAISYNICWCDNMLVFYNVAIRFKEFILHNNLASFYLLNHWKWYLVLQFCS